MTDLLDGAHLPWDFVAAQAPYRRTRRPGEHPIECIACQLARATTPPESARPTIAERLWPRPGRTTTRSTR